MAATLASAAGWRVNALVTPVANRSRSVTVAASATATNGSPTRFCESVNVMPSQPICSARSAWAATVPISGIRIVQSSIGRDARTASPGGVAVEHRGAQIAEPARRPKNVPSPRLIPLTYPPAARLALGAARREEARSGPAVGCKHPSVDIGVQTAERERRVDRSAFDAEVDRPQRGHERLDERRQLPELRIGAARGVFVVARDRRYQRGLRHSHVAGQLLDRLRRVREPQAEQVAFVDRLVEDHEHIALVLHECLPTDAPGIGVLVHESATLAVDEDRAAQTVRRPERQRALEHLESQRRTADALPETDAPAVVGVGPDAPSGIRRHRGRAVRGEHRLVVREASAREHHPAPRPHVPGRVVGADGDADDRAVCVDDQALPFCRSSTTYC